MRQLGHIHQTATLDTPRDRCLIAFVYLSDTPTMTRNQKRPSRRRRGHVGGVDNAFGHLVCCR